MQSVNFQLPQTLPQFPLAKGGKARLEQKYDRAKCEMAINQFQYYQTSNQEGELALVRFFRIMSRDVNWMAANPQAAGAVMRAVSVCYLSSQNGEIIQKIAKYVRANPKGLHAAAPVDLVLKSEGQTISCSSLLMGCHSLAFERMFKGGYCEAIRLKQYYENSPATERLKAPLPEMPIGDISAKTLRVFVDVVSTGNSKALADLDEDQAAELIAFADMKLALKSILPNIKSVLLRNLTPECALVLFNWMMEIEKEKYLESAKAPDEKALSIMVEMSLMKEVSPSNAVVLYELAKAKGLRALSMECIKSLFNDITIEEAQAGALSQTIWKDKKAMSGTAVMEYCADRLLDKLPEAFAALNHRLPPYKQGTSIPGMIAGSIHMLIHRDKTERAQKEKEAAMDLIQQFSRIAPNIHKVRNLSLKKLQPDELAWFLSLLPNDVVELDLSDCHLNGKAFKEIQRFTKLKTLTLRNVEDLSYVGQLGEKISLEHLDLTDCANLGRLEFVLFPNLQFIYLKGCKCLNAQYHSLGGAPENLKYVSYDRNSGLVRIFQMLEGKIVINDY